MGTDPRAGKLCTSCNQPKPDPFKAHCASPTCAWWQCPRCRANNDPQGNNDRTTDDGTTKRPLP